MQGPRMGNVLYPVADMDAAVAFYRDALGLPVKFRDGDRFAALDAGGVVLALVCGPEAVTGGTPAASFQVGDLDEAVRIATAGGAVVAQPATTGPHEVRIVLTDPSGNLVVLYEKR